MKNATEAELCVNDIRLLFAIFASENKIQIMKKSIFTLALLAVGLTVGAQKPLVIEKQGNFTVGGKNVQREGKYDNSKFVGCEGNLAGASRQDMPFADFGSALPADAFHGEAYINKKIDNDQVFNFPQTNLITFAPGSHSNWHRHGGMDLLVAGGVGIYQEEGKPAQILRKGDVVHIPAGTRHWHGAAPGNWFQQIVIYDSKWNGQGNYSDGDNTVSSDYYNSVALEEFPHQNHRTDISMFAPADSLIQMPTFNGKVRLSETLGEQNASGAPSIHNVVFEPGVYNAWHEHAGGQILIVTDGTCYHQIKGQPVEILHAGDVAKCPPNTLHWHGAAPGSRMAHLAANTNPDKKGVKWYKLISKKQYDKIGK